MAARRGWRLGCGSREANQAALWFSAVLLLAAAAEGSVTLHNSLVMLLSRGRAPSQPALAPLLHRHHGELEHRFEDRLCNPISSSMPG